MEQSQNVISGSDAKRYKVGLTQHSELVLWVGDHFEKSSCSVYGRIPGQSFSFEPVPKSFLIDDMCMNSLTCTGAKLLQSKVVNGKVVSPGVDIADDWIRQNGGKFVPFDSSKFMIQRDYRDMRYKSKLLYVGENYVHVDIPDGVRHIDRMFSRRTPSSVSIPDSVETAFDIFDGHDDIRKDVIRGLKNGPFYAMGREAEHTSGWVLPEGAAYLGSALKYIPSNSYRSIYPVVWYERGPTIYEYDPSMGIPVERSAEYAVSKMCDYASETDGIVLSGAGLRLICSTDVSGPMFGRQNAFFDFVYANACGMPDSNTGRLLYAFNDIENVDFGDLGLVVAPTGNDNGSDVVYNASWTTLGHDRDGNNLYGKPFNIPEGIITIDRLFYGDCYLKSGVSLPASVVSAESAYEGSLVEKLPDFAKDSRLENANKLCCNCSRLVSIPDLPDGVMSTDRAFTGTLWDSNMPIDNVQGMEPDLFTDDAFDFVSEDIPAYRVPDVE